MTEKLDRDIPQIIDAQKIPGNRFITLHKLALQHLGEKQVNKIFIESGFRSSYKKIMRVS